MRRTLILAFFLVFPAAAALAQPMALFGNGKSPVFKEEDYDRRFLKTRLFRGLTQGTQDARCEPLLAGFLTLLAEAAPYLHKRDENFHLDPHLVGALQSQLSSPRFPAAAYLASMV